MKEAVRYADDFCARTGRVGQAHIDLFTLSAIHIFWFSTSVAEVTNLRITTERGDGAPRVDANDGEKAGIKLAKC